MGYDNHIFYETVPSDYICIHCQSVLCEALASPCGHVLCTSCWIQHENKKLSCPLCTEKEALEPEDFIKLVLIDEDINSMTTWCSYEGCHEHLPLQEREKHLKECQHRNKFRKTNVRPDHTIIEMGDDTGEEPETKGERLRKVVFRVCASLGVWALFAAISSAVPGAPLSGFEWCEQIDIDQFLSTFNG